MFVMRERFQTFHFSSVSPGVKLNLVRTTNLSEALSPPPSGSTALCAHTLTEQITVNG